MTLTLNSNVPPEIAFHVVSTLESPTNLVVGREGEHGLLQGRNARHQGGFKKGGRGRSRKVILSPSGALYEMGVKLIKAILKDQSHDPEGSGLSQRSAVKKTGGVCAYGRCGKLWIN